MIVHSGSLEPPEPAYCELCCEYDDDCTCDAGYEEERSDD